MEAEPASGQSVQRYYDPGINGRFLSVDPVTAHSPGGTFNRYWYANANPYRFADPDGRMPSDGPMREQEKAKGQDFTFAMQDAGGVGRFGRWTLANFPRRFAAATKLVENRKGKMESTPHASEAKAANSFHRTMQPISSKYGVEIESLITNDAGVYRLFGTGVGNIVDPTNGIGYTVNGPSNGMPTIHSHPDSGDQSSKQYPYPFSVPDYYWYMAARSETQYLSTPDGVYEFNTSSRRIEDISE